MPHTITSLLVSGPVTVPLVGGGSVRLSPGETSEELPDADVLANPAIEKLTARGAIDLRRVPKNPGRGRSGSKGD